MSLFDRDAYETPQPWFDAFQREFGEFEVDVAATATNKRCPKFFADAFAVMNWHRFGQRFWCNPPYSAVGPWFEKCHSEFLASGKTITIVMLVLTPNGETYWRHFVTDGHAATVYLVHGRISFLHPETKEPCIGNRYGSMLIVFKPTKRKYTKLKSFILYDMVGHGQKLIRLSHEVYDRFPFIKSVCAYGT